MVQLIFIRDEEFKDAISVAFSNVCEFLGFFLVTLLINKADPRTALTEISHALLLISISPLNVIMNK